MSISAKDAFRNYEFKEYFIYGKHEMLTSVITEKLILVNLHPMKCRLAETSIQVNL